MSFEPLLDGVRLTLQVGLLAGLCRLAWRAVAARAPDLPALDRLLAAAVLGVAGVVCLLQAAGFAGGLGVGLALAGLAAVWGLAPQRRAGLPGPPEVEWRSLGAGLAPAALAAAALLVLLGQALARVPVEWDGLSYHLFFPAHYLQEGRILHLEMGRPIDQAAFYPQNAELTYALLMALGAQRPAGRRVDGGVDGARRPRHRPPGARPRRLARRRGGRRGARRDSSRRSSAGRRRPTSSRC